MRTKIILILIILPLLANGYPSGSLGTAIGPDTGGQTAGGDTSPPISQDSPPASIWGLGQLWAGISQWDTGYCPGYGMPSGSGARPSLAMPVEGTIHPERGFRVGHSGVDILAPDGTAVEAAAAGTVIWAGWSTWGGGEVVAVSHGGGWYTLYFHLSAVTVTCGQWVGTGSIIGLTGQTGSSNFAHLHLELRNGHYAFAPL